MWPNVSIYVNNPSRVITRLLYRVQSYPMESSSAFGMREMLASMNSMTRPPYDISRPSNGLCHRTMKLLERSCSYCGITNGEYEY
jgi:hypothetical protein